MQDAETSNFKVTLIICATLGRRRAIENISCAPREEHGVYSYQLTAVSDNLENQLTTRFLDIISCVPPSILIGNIGYLQHFHGAI